MAADRMTIANPVCVQMNTTSRRNVLTSGCSVEPGDRLAAERRDDRVEQTDLLALAVVVDELPDDSGADERDGDRHEDEDS